MIKLARNTLDISWYAFKLSHFELQVVDRGVIAMLDMFHYILLLGRVS